MKKLVVVSLMAACMFSGCRTVVEGEAERYDNGQLVGRSKMRVLATGDKASQIAAEGIGVNAEPDEVNAVLNSTSASQKSSGIDNVLKAFSDLVLNVASMRLNGATASQDAVYDIVNTATGVSTLLSSSVAQRGFTGTVSSDAIGVYGRESCSRCQAYVRNHPEVEMIDIDNKANQATMWNALKARGFTGSGIQLPVEITADSFIQQVK